MVRTTFTYCCCTRIQTGCLFFTWTTSKPQPCSLSPLWEQDISARSFIGSLCNSIRSICRSSALSSSKKQRCLETAPWQLTDVPRTENPGDSFGGHGVNFPVLWKTPGHTIETCIPLLFFFPTYFLLFLLSSRLQIFSTRTEIKRLGFMQHARAHAVT